MVVCRSGINYIHESVYILVLTCSGNHSFRFCWYFLFLCSSDWSSDKLQILMIQVVGV